MLVMFCDCYQPYKNAEATRFVQFECCSLSGSRCTTIILGPTNPRIQVYPLSRGFRFKLGAEMQSPNVGKEGLFVVASCYKPTGVNTLATDLLPIITNNINCNYYS